MSTTKLLKTFIIGSSFPVMILPLIYIGGSHLIAKIKLNGRNPLKPGTHYEIFPIFLPIYYGIFVVLAQSVGKLFIQDDFLRLVIFGGLCGALLSIIGRFREDYPKRVFKHIYNYPDHLEFLIHPIAFIVYSLEFGFGVYALLKLFNLL